MKRTIYLLGILAVAFVLLFAFNSSASAETTPTPVYVQGDISGYVNWTSDNVYIVIGDITVDDGATLNIANGTTVLFENDTAMRVNGTLIADATGGSAITFSANSSTDVGAWAGITVNSTGSATMKNVVISYADVSLFVNDGVISLQSVTLNNTNTGISIIESGSNTSLAFADVTIENYYTFGIHVQNLDRAVTFSLADSELTGADGSEGVVIEAFDEFNGTIAATFDNVDITGGDAAIDVYAELDASCTLTDCNLMDQNNVALDVESVFGSVDVSTDNCVIDGSEATSADWFYTIYSTDYQFEVIPRDYSSANQTDSDLAILTADLPFTFNLGGVDYDQAVMANDGLYFAPGVYVSPVDTMNLNVIFFGYKVYDDMAVFQWYMYDDSNTALVDYYEVMIYANGDIQINYNVMESMGMSGIELSAGAYYDFAAMTGNPFDLDYTSIIIGGDSISEGTGVYTATLLGEIVLTVENTVISNFGDGAVYAYAEEGFIAVDMTGTTVSWIDSVYDEALNFWTESGAVDISITDSTFSQIYDGVFDIWADVYEADDQSVDISGNTFERCTAIGYVETYIYGNEEDDTGVDQTMVVDRIFSGNTVSDSGELGFYTYAYLEDNSTLDLTVNDAFLDNVYSNTLYMGDYPMDQWTYYSQESLFDAYLYYGNDVNSKGNESVAWNVDATGNTFDNLPAIPSASGDVNVPGIISISGYVGFSGEKLDAAMTFDVSNNVVVLDPAPYVTDIDEEMVQIYTDYGLEEGNAAVVESFIVDGNSFTDVSGNYNVGAIYIESDANFGENDVAVKESSIAGSYEINGNYFEGMNYGAYLWLGRDSENVVGNIAVDDAVSFDDNIAEANGPAFYLETYDNEFEFDYYFPLVTLYDGENSALSVAYNIDVEMMGNVLNTTYVNPGPVGPDGDWWDGVLYADIGAYVSTEYSLLTDSYLTASANVVASDNELMTLNDNWPHDGIEVYVGFGAYGPNTASDATADITVTDNIVSGATGNDNYHHGIYINIWSDAWNYDERDDQVDQAMSTLDANADVSGNVVDSCMYGIGLYPEADAGYADASEYMTFAGSIMNNEITNCSGDGISVWSYIEVANYDGFNPGTPSANNTYSITISQNKIDAVDMDGDGIDFGTEYDDELYYIDPAWAYMSGSVTFTIEDNEIANADTGIDGEVYGMYSMSSWVLISGNTIDNAWFGIYIEDATGEISENVISNIQYDGIYGDELVDMIIADNTATNTGLDYDEDYGIELYDSENVTVSGNTLTDNVYGLHISDVVDCTIIDNTVDRNEYGGAYFEDCVSTLIEGNTFNENGAGVYIEDGWDWVFGNNTVNNNLGEGLYIDLEDGRGYLYNNEFCYNDEMGLEVYSYVYMGGEDWYGVQWIIDDEASVIMNPVDFNGEVTVAEGGILNIESVEYFYFYDSQVEGAPTFLINGTLNAINTNFEAGYYFEFEVYGVVDAEYCTFSEMYQAYIGEGSDATFRACTFNPGVVDTILIDNSSPVFSMCTMLGQFSLYSSSPYAVVVIQGADANPTITGGIIMGGYHGIFAKDCGLGNVYDTIFILNSRAGIYGDNVSGKIHDNVFMLNGASILLEDSAVSIEDNEIGWTHYIDALVEYAPLIEAVAHHMYEAVMDVLDIVNVNLNATELQDLLNDFTGMSTAMSFPQILSSSLSLAETGVYAKNSELVMSGNTYGMLYQCVYVVGGTLSFSDKISSSTLEIPYFLGLNSSSLSVPVKNVNGLYASDAVVTISGAEISVVDDAVVLESCNATISNSVLDAGDFDLYAMNGCEVSVVGTVLDKVKSEDSNSIAMYAQLEVIAVDHDGNPVSGRTVKIYDANGVKVAEGKTGSDGKFTASVLAYTITDSGNGPANTYTVKVDFENGEVSADATVSGLAQSMTITAEKDNTQLYIGLAILAIAVLLIAAVLVMRSRKQ